MTAPVQHGFADWNRQGPTAATIFLRDAKTNTGFTQYGPFFLGVTQALGLNVISTTNQVNINVQFYSEPALLNQLALQVIVVPAGGTFRGAIRVSGPYMRINVATPSGTASWQIFAYE